MKVIEKLNKNNVRLYNSPNLPHLAEQVGTVEHRQIKNCEQAANAKENLIKH